MKKKSYVEMRYYDVPQKEWVLALMGDEWVRVYGEGMVNSLHFHNLYEVGICRGGTGEMVFDKKVLPFRPGMISFIPKGYPHTTNSTPGTKGFWEYLFFDPEMILKSVYGTNQLKIRQTLSVISRDVMYGETKNYPAFTRLVNEIMEEMKKKDRYYIEKVHALLAALLFEAVRILDLGDERVQIRGEKVAITNALRYVDQHYAEPIRIEDLARECSISETHFRRLFSEAFSISPVEYLNMIRVIKACDLMKTSDEAMSTVASKCGFTTVSTFDRNFKNVMGVTPYQWKKDPKNYESRLLEVNVSVKRGW